MILKLLILLLVCCGSANSCVHRRVDNTTGNANTTITATRWETCCINSTSGARYGCMADQQNSALTCLSGDDQFVEMVCLKDTSNPCSLTFDDMNLEVIYNGITYFLNMNSSSSYLMIQRNIVAENQDFFNKDLATMKKTLFTPVNVKPVGNFWIGLSLLYNFIKTDGYSTALEIKVNHTVNNDSFAVNYDSLNLLNTDFYLDINGFSFRNADNGVEILDAITKSSPSSSSENTFANMNQFATDMTCVNEQKGAWWMNQGCSGSNLNSDDGAKGWEYSTTNSATAITGSLMGIRFTPVYVVDGN